MAAVRKFLFIPILLVLCKVLQGAVVEIIETEGSSGSSASVIISDLGDDDEFYFDSETPYHYKAIKFINSKFERIPSNIFSKFPNITNLDISNCGLNSVSSEEFAEVTFLEVLTLSDNQVFKLKEDVFTHLPSLKTLALANMSLTKLEPKLFSNQGELTTLDLQHNSLDRIEKKVLEPLKKLQWLNLRYNRIFILEDKQFAFNQHLHTIDLAFNEWSSSERGAFLETTPKLANLFLQNNDIGYILAPKCNTLLLHNNSLDKIELLGPVKHLSLGFNQISDQPEIDYSEAITLDLTGNHIETIGPFKNATKLEKLNLSRNMPRLGLKLLENAFEGLTSLKQLSLANLGFKPEVVQKDRLFADLINLEVLDLSKNRFNYVLLDYFRNSPKLKKIFVGNLQ